jgi:amino acid transporter
MSVSAEPHDVGAAATQGSGFERQLTWRDGFAIALVVPVAIFVTLGPTIGLLGGWATAALFSIACLVGIVQNFMYAEMAGMFPNKPGGIALYAHEGWKRYFAPAGALAAFGYWAGWAFSNSIFALTFGSLVAAEFFPDATWTISTGTADIGLGTLIGVPVLLSAWFLNVRGIRPAVQINKLLAVFAVGLMALLVVGPIVTGDLSFSNLTWNLGQDGQAWGGLRLALVFLFIMGWSAYATEICATFTPEYKDPRRDTTKALRMAGLFTLAVTALVPLGLGGTVGDSAIAQDPGTVYAAAFEQIIGPASGLVTILICLAIYLVMNACTADAGRALYGIAKDDMTIRQLNQLNERGVPSRALTVDLIVNLALLLFVSNVLGIIFSSNIGYFVAVIFALTGFILLRRDRPAWPRPIRLGNGWIAVAGFLALYNLILLVIGFLHPEDGGYGGATEQLIGVGILASSLLLFVFRRVVQDRSSLRLRELGADAPPAEPAEVAPAPAVGT